jgi:transglutaminase-like putative cysteine protease
MEAIRTSLRYQERYAKGTQSAGATLAAGSGTCRDFAMLMIEAARSLGFGARFATGYLYSAGLDGQQANRGAAATHAWAEVFVPGAGWTDYDPTNGIVNGADLIKVAVARKPGQAAPVTGTFIGPGEVETTLDVAIDVTLLD